MKDITSLSIDLAKNVFQLHGTDKMGKTILKQKICRTKLLEFVANLKPSKIFMEACGSANYWGRKFKEHGHEVKLINPRYVKPYVKRNKNDVNDAAGIAAAARDPDMRFCEVKTAAQQDLQVVHRIRSLRVQQRTAAVNQVRGILAEYGIVMAKSIAAVRKKMPEILDANQHNIGKLALGCVSELYDNICFLDQQIANYDKKIAVLFKSNEACQRLATIPGIGEISATILAAVLGNGSAFKNGRHFAAFLGLVPKQHSSGGKERLLGISKGGDTYIRTLLIHGARTVIRWIEGKGDFQSMWLGRLLATKGYNKTAVALANKIARMAWAITKEKTTYNVNHKPKFLKVA